MFKFIYFILFVSCIFSGTLSTIQADTAYFQEPEISAIFKKASKQTKRKKKYRKKKKLKRAKKHRKKNYWT